MKKLLTVLASTLLLFVYCSDSTIKEKKPWPYKLTYLKGEVWINEKHATVESTVQETDTITTKANGYAIVTLSDFATISLKPNTKIYLNNLGAGKSEIFQESGKTFSKVKTGTGYAIKTPTMVAGVRGTSFEVATSAKTSTVSLLEGKVEATSTSTSEVVNIESGQKLKTRVGLKIDKAEMTQKELDSIKLVSVFTQITPNENIKDIDNLLNKIDIDDHPVIVSPQKKTMTLEQIKKTYGRIAKITTKSGQEFTGYFAQSGATMKIITPNGNVSVDTSQVAKVTPIP